MKKIIVVAFVLLFSSSFSQSIKGKVVDEQNKPLYGANVYFDGTTLTTISDENGNFTLYFGAKLNSLLIISYVGFETQFINLSEVNKELYIVLKVAAISIKEVVVRKQRFSRKQKMQLFKEQFLGLTKAGKNATIENEEDISFDYDESKKVLLAYSDKPLLINNALLGYKITYELVNFEVNFNRISIASKDVVRSYYAGLSRFEEVNSNPNSQKERLQCYEGSQLHFFRNLVNNVWGNDNFILCEGLREVNPNNCFTITDALESKKVQVIQPKVTYKGKSFPHIFKLLFRNKQYSQIIFQTDTFYVDQFGNNSNIVDIIFTGHISAQKVGDMLPMDYGLK